MARRKRRSFSREYKAEVVALIRGGGKSIGAGARDLDLSETAVLRWAIRSRLEPIKRVARMIKKHWEGVINAATTNVTNARAEALNSRIQWVKRMACDYRNRRNFRNTIYFHLGGLNLYPYATESAHSKA